MEFGIELLLSVEGILLLGSMVVYGVSKRTSRRLYERHETLRAITLAILGLAILAIFGAGAVQSDAYPLVFLPPLPILGLCIAVLLRCAQARSIRRRGRP